MAAARVDADGLHAGGVDHVVGAVSAKPIIVGDVVDDARHLARGLQCHDRISAHKHSSVGQYADFTGGKTRELEVLDDHFALAAAKVRVIDFLDGARSRQTGCDCQEGHQIDGGLHLWPRVRISIDPAHCRAGSLYQSGVTISTLKVL